DYPLIQCGVEGYPVERSAPCPDRCLPGSYFLEFHVAFCDDLILISVPDEPLGGYGHTGRLDACDGYTAGRFNYVLPFIALNNRSFEMIPGTVLFVQRPSRFVQEARLRLGIQTSRCRSRLHPPLDAAARQLLLPYH